MSVFEDRFPEIIAALPEVLDAAVKAGAELVEQAAKERVPVRTGDLRDAIHTERVRHAEYAVVGGDGKAFYGHLVEFGTTRAPAHPFLVPGLEERREMVVALVDAPLHKL
jgi:HK97 gp10 family phage protein